MLKLRLFYTSMTNPILPGIYIYIYIYIYEPMIYITKQTKLATINLTCTQFDYAHFAYVTNNNNIDKQFQFFCF